MKIIYKEPNPSGAYPPIQEGSYTRVPSGMAEWPEELETDRFYQYNGFVKLSFDGDRVASCEPDVEAWEAWKASLPPEPEPEPEPESELEQIKTKIAVMSANQAPVMAAARAYAMTAVSIPDTQALDMAALFPSWAQVLEEGAELPQGRIIEKDGTLYRVVQTVTPAAHQVPGGEGMLAIYRPIDREHAGTVDDPIPWVYGMDCLAGKVYSYNGGLYRVADGGNMIPCVWAPDTPGLWQWEKITKED